MRLLINQDSFEGTNRHISKRGSRSLRKCGYEVMMALKSSKPKEDNAVYEYMLQKEAEGKNKKLVKIAGLNKFLRIYYARVMELYQGLNATSSYICKKDTL